MDRYRACDRVVSPCESASRFKAIEVVSLEIATTASQGEEYQHSVSRFVVI